MNVRLLRRIQRKILAEPKQFDMSYWYRFDKEIPNCNTAACIAGWAVALHRGKTPLLAGRSIIKGFSKTSNTVHGESASTMNRRANRALGISRDSARLLYSVCRWPMKFRVPWERESYDRDFPRRAYLAKIAVRRIDHFIKTKGAE